MPIDQMGNTTPEPTENPLGMPPEKVKALFDKGILNEQTYNRMAPAPSQNVEAPPAEAVAPTGPAKSADPFDSYIAKASESAEQANQQKLQADYTSEQERLKRYEDDLQNRVSASIRDGSTPEDVKRMYGGQFNIVESQKKVVGDLGAKLQGTPVSGTGNPEVMTADLKGQPQAGQSAAPMTLASDIKGAQAQQPNPMNQMMEYLKPNFSGIDLMQEGIKEAAKTGEAKGAEQAAQLGRIQNEDAERIRSQEAQQMERKTQLDAQLSKMNAKADELGSAEIDPGRLWKNKTTGDKVMMGIAMALGAFGSGGNKALNVLHDAIETDIGAQKANNQNKKDAYTAQAGLYNDMLSQFKDERLATDATRIAYYNNAQIKVAQIAARYSGPEAKARADQLLGELQQKKNDAQQAFAFNVMQKMPQMTGNVNLTKQEDRDRWVPLHGFALTKEDATKAKDYLADANAAKDNIAELVKISGVPGSSVTPELRARAQSISTIVSGLLRTSILGPGTVNDAERAMLESIIANPTTIFSMSSTNKTKLNTLLQAIDRNKDAKLKAFGIHNPTEALGFKPQLTGY